MHVTLVADANLRREVHTLAPWPSCSLLQACRNSGDFHTEQQGQVKLVIQVRQAFCCFVAGERDPSATVATSEIRQVVKV
jgi:hypothetical protein